MGEKKMAPDKQCMVSLVLSQELLADIWETCMALEITKNSRSKKGGPNKPHLFTIPLTP